MCLDCSFNQKPKTEIIICAWHKYVDIMGYFQLGRRDFGFSSEQTNFKASTSERRRRRMQMHNKPWDSTQMKWDAEELSPPPSWSCLKFASLSHQTQFFLLLLRLRYTSCVHTNFWVNKRTFISNTISITNTKPLGIWRVSHLELTTTEQPFFFCF